MHGHNLYIKILLYSLICEYGILEDRISDKLGDDIQIGSKWCIELEGDGF